MASPSHQSFKIAEIAELAQHLRKALGRKLNAEEQEFFLLAEQAYAADEQARLSPSRQKTAA